MVYKKRYSAERNSLNYTGFGLYDTLDQQQDVNVEATNQPFNITLNDQTQDHKILLSLDCAITTNGRVRFGYVSLIITFDNTHYFTLTMTPRSDNIAVHGIDNGVVTFIAFVNDVVYSGNEDEAYLAQESQSVPLLFSSPIDRNVHRFLCKLTYVALEHMRHLKSYLCEQERKNAPDWDGLDRVIQMTLTRIRVVQLNIPIGLSDFTHAHYVISHNTGVYLQLADSHDAIQLQQDYFEIAPNNESYTLHYAKEHEHLRIYFDISHVYTTGNVDSEQKTMFTIIFGDGIMDYSVCVCVYKRQQTFFIRYMVEHKHVDEETSDFLLLFRDDSEEFQEHALPSVQATMIEQEDVDFLFQEAKSNMVNDKFVTTVQNFWKVCLQAYIQNYKSNEYIWTNHAQYDLEIPLYFYQLCVVDTASQITTFYNNPDNIFGPTENTLQWNDGQFDMFPSSELMYQYRTL